MVEKILVVDDSFDDLESMNTILKKEKYEVFIATNGADALDLLDDNHPNLILLNINMPTLSGYDLLRLLRGRLGNGVKIVYISITPKQEVDMEGVDGFIQKPFSPESLLDEVRKVLK